MIARDYIAGCVSSCGKEGRDQVTLVGALGPSVTPICLNSNGVNPMHGLFVLSAVRVKQDNLGLRAPSYPRTDNRGRRCVIEITHGKNVDALADDRVFFLTPLLLNLCTGASDDENAGYIRRMDERRSGNIIVETNFRLYAYTSSSLQLAILSTFTEMTYRFNDMSVGILTRESVRRALQVGITASQIISFLRANAHKQCLATGGPLNCLPVTVADQIRLWEDERKRLTFTEATLYSAFEGEPEFIGVRDFSLREGILLWADSDKKLVIVSDEGHEKVRAWWKANKASM
ncbi:hypothetical protein Y032_0090g2390 [Ancylostoma ceylanicum]|uniref:General transcription factor IIH subunit 4 n=1 Tax=Ancylostoma ceylanicum TaxID=53326 RepID=A0A016TMX0_9BILA|nr:hypothetical protein Y032_0090g2390 [Ancylostoma ceylanicum]